MLCAKGSYRLTAEKIAVIPRGSGLVKLVSKDPEIEIMKKLKGLSRVIQLIAAPTHKEDGELIQEVITEIYPLGSLDQFDQSKLSLKDKVCMARDLMEALRGAHARNISHNDIGSKNTFVEENKDPNLKGVKYRLVLADFGEAKENCEYGYENDIVRSGLLIKGLKANHPQFDAITQDVMTIQRDIHHWYKEYDNLLSKV
jgi:serine/threonine protein kinase